MVLVKVGEALADDLQAQEQGANVTKRLDCCVPARLAGFGSVLQAGNSRCHPDARGRGKGGTGCQSFGALLATLTMPQCLLEPCNANVHVCEHVGCAKKVDGAPTMSTLLWSSRRPEAMLLICEARGNP